MVAAYLRISTALQNESSQRHSVLEFAQEKGLKIDKIVSEQISGNVKIQDRKLSSLIS